MKIKPADADRFCARPPAELVLAVVYGPDEGLVRERGRKLVKAIAGDVSDPFCVVELTREDLQSEPGRLADEAAQIPMMGGRKTVWVRQAGDWLAKAATDWLDHPTSDAVIVVEAGDLPPRSSLRKLGESAPNGAAIACYVDDARSIEQVIEETLRAHELRINPDALAYLAGRLGADRALTRSEIEKLALYKGRGPATVELADAEAAVADSAAIALDQLVDSTLTGDLKTLDRTYERAMTEAVSPVAIIRAVQNELHRIGLVQAAMAQGRREDEAMKVLRPPVFFKRKAAFKSALRAWPHGRIADARALLIDAERDCKTTGLVPETVCARALLRLGTAAARSKR